MRCVLCAFVCCGWLLNSLCFCCLPATLLFLPHRRRSCLSCRRIEVRCRHGGYGWMSCRRRPATSSGLHAFSRWRRGVAWVDSSSSLSVCVCVCVRVDSVCRGQTSRPCLWQLDGSAQQDVGPCDGVSEADVLFLIRGTQVTEVGCQVMPRPRSLSASQSLAKYGTSTVLYGTAHKSQDPSQTPTLRPAQRPLVV